MCIKTNVKDCQLNLNFKLENYIDTQRTTQNSKYNPLQEIHKSGIEICKNCIVAMSFCQVATMLYHCYELPKIASLCISIYQTK